MVNYVCEQCNKNFDKKSNFITHTQNKKRPCSTIKIDNIQQIDIILPKNTEILTKDNFNIIDDSIETKTLNLTNKHTCMYCNTTFTQKVSLNRHLKDRCKSKKYLDELEILKEKLNLLTNTFNKELEKIKNENKELKKENDKLKNENEFKIKNNNSLKSKRENIPQTLRFAVWEKYLGKNNEGKCYCCKNTIISITNFDCGHIISNKDGGEIHINNLKPICGLCNSSMGTMNMNDFMKKYGF